MIAQRAVPVFQVSNVNDALKYYVDVLGFEADFRVGEYAGVKLGAVGVHLSKHGDSDFAKPLGGGIAYLFCDEVDGYFDEIRRKGAKVKYPPQDTHYGMREFMVSDLDGHHLVFGCEPGKA